MGEPICDVPDCGQPAVVLVEPGCYICATHNTYENGSNK